MLLCLVGVGISAYLSWAYTTGNTPVCGASGGCGAVQNSPYARIAGVPIPILGLGVYVILIGLGLLAIWWEAQREPLLLALFGFALAGLLFSGYLTYLELFVIEAICKWCVGSAVVMVFVFALALMAHRTYQQEG